MQQPFHIIFEGLDGVGKTTLTKLLADSRKDTVLLKSPPNDVSIIRPFFDTQVCISRTLSLSLIFF